MVARSISTKGTNPMTDAQTKALNQLKAANGQPVVLHVGTGGALVKAGLATKDDSKGHGALMAAYRIKAS